MNLRKSLLLTCILNLKIPDLLYDLKYRDQKSLKRLSYENSYQKGPKISEPDHRRLSMTLLVRSRSSVATTSQYFVTSKKP